MTTVASYDPNCVDEGDTAWVMMATVLVLGMIPGLALYEGGLGPSKHALSIFVQIIGGVMVGASGFPHHSVSCSVPLAQT